MVAIASAGGGAGRGGVEFFMRMPVVGISYLNHPDWARAAGHILQNADLAGGLVALGLLWWVNRDPGAGGT